MRPRALLPAATVLAVAGTAILGAAASGSSGDHHGGRGHEGDLLRASVTGSLTTDPPVAGVGPGGAPWTSGPSTVRVGLDGDLRLELEGLVIPGRGVGPVTEVSVSLVCGGAVVDTSVSAALSPSGDARLRDRLAVPARCIAPVVLVDPNRNPAVYIALSGSQQ